MNILGLALALAIGVSLGLLGGGGSILAVPIFVYVLDLDPRIAIVVSLGVVGIVSAAGIIPHARAGRVEWRAGFLFATGSAAGAFGGSVLAELVTGATQLTVFALVMLVAAVAMLRRSKEVQPPGDRRYHGWNDVVRLLLIAVGVGVMTGFVGVGGGFMIVPALALLAGMPMAQCSGTSLMVIAINSAAGFIGYWMKPEVRATIEGTSIAGTSLVLYSLLFTAIAIAGVISGSLLSHRIASTTLRAAFAWFLVVVAVGILAQRLVAG